MKKQTVKTGRNLYKDENVYIGYPVSREIKNQILKIGDNAYIRSGTVIYLGSKIGHNLKTGHNVVIREENKIGDDFSIWNNSVIDYGCRIGNGVKIHSNCYIAQYTTINDKAFIAPGVTTANDLHPGCKYFRKCMCGPTIGEKTVVGVNVTVLPYVVIGKYSLIGSGSVVTHNIPSYSVAYGNPARVVKKVSELKCVRGYTEKPYTDKKEGP